MQLTATPVADVLNSEAFRIARASLRDTDAATLQHMCDATVIPAPSHGEAARGEWLSDRFRELGLEPVLDDVGNISAASPGTAPGDPRIVIASHLDTVFAEGTDLTIRRDGARVYAPGISDNSRGLAGSIAIARALAAAGWPLRVPVEFVGSVGEEGAGDLFGVKHYVAMNAAHIAAFIALDGAGATRIIASATGSRRLRVTFRGPGGHSWSDWGAPNAIHAIGRAVQAMLRIELPAEPRTTLSIGRIGGGTSINSIPDEAWLEVDMRSEEHAALAQLESRVRAAVAAAAKEEARGGSMTVDVDVFGDRPAGRTDHSHPLVQAAVRATRAVGLAPVLTSSSTDANVAMSRGIPSIGIGAGGDAAETHTLREWYDNTGGLAGLERALLTLLQVAGA